MATPTRGQDADWRDPWPVRGVRQGDAADSAGTTALRDDGYPVVFDVVTLPEDRDEYQDHLNNTAAVRMFNELRTAYIAARFAPDWVRHVRRTGLTVVVRELHVAYDSEGWMHERYVGATRVAQRRGLALVLEQRLVEAIGARSLARAWILQLLVGAEGVTAFPDWYLDMVAEVQGAPVPDVPATRPPWGPPS